MKIYLVGGAVRDHLLNYPVVERDWVVVGATPEQMLKLGYRKVGRDFPVFLHPQTSEEYALARTERKMGRGYYGFVCDASPSVTLEDDLSRRDLTINAMALDDSGQLIDPFQGEKDLKAKVLRHVSLAFVEDPVRVLRVARFAARYHHLEFTLAGETRALMYSMSQQGELSHLVAERVWQEWQGSLQEKNPEIFIETLRSCGALARILPEIDGLFGIPNAITSYQKIDSGIESLMSLKKAAEISNDPLVRFAALVHNVGKAATPIHEWPNHPDHAEKGATIIEDLCLRLRIPRDYCQLSMLASRMYITIHRIFKLSENVIIAALEKTDAFRRAARFEQLLKTCEAIALGDDLVTTYPQRDAWRKVLQECVKITAAPWVKEGITGQAIQSRLHQERVQVVKKMEHLLKN